jgi:hypothetical protein
VAKMEILVVTWAILVITTMMGEVLVVEMKQVQWSWVTTFIQKSTSSCTYPCPPCTIEVTVVVPVAFPWLISAPAMFVGGSWVAFGRVRVTTRWHDDRDFTAIADCWMGNIVLCLLLCILLKEDKAICGSNRIYRYYLCIQICIRLYNYKSICMIIYIYMYHTLVISFVRECYTQALCILFSVIINLFIYWYV